jgi:hypothetical protein
MRADKAFGGGWTRPKLDPSTRFRNRDAGGGPSRRVSVPDPNATKRPANGSLAGTRKVGHQTPAKPPLP